MLPQKTKIYVADFTIKGDVNTEWKNVSTWCRKILTNLGHFFAIFSWTICDKSLHTVILFNWSSGLGRDRSGHWTPPDTAVQ